MGNTVTPREGVEDLLKKTASRPNVLLEIYQGQDENIKKLSTKTFGHSNGICEGMCAIWAKYTAMVREDEFIKDFHDRIVIEIVRAHAKYFSVKTQSRNNLKFVKLMSEQLEKRLQKELNESKELAEKLKPYLTLTTLTIDQDNEATLLLNKIKDGPKNNIGKINNEISDNGRFLEETEKSTNEALDAIHGLKIYQRGKGANKNLLSSLNNMISLAGRQSNILLIRMHNGKGGGHALAFSAFIKSDIEFIDPNTCLYSFKNFLSFISYFQSYWNMFYADDYDKYDYDYDIVGIPEFKL